MKNNTSDFNFKWITDWDTIYSEAFQKDWLHWAETAENKHVFFHPALCMAWLKTYRPIRALEPIFCIAKNNKTTIFFPLVIWRKNWKNAFQNVVVPVGYSDFDYHDPLIINASSIEVSLNLFFVELIENLKQHYSFDLININGLRTQLSIDTCTQEKAIAPFANLQQFKNGEDFLKSLKTKLRGDIRRQMRRLNDAGVVSLINHDGTKLTTETINKFLLIHAKLWPNAYKAPLFHEHLINAAIRNGIVRFSELKVNDETISWHLGFQFNNSFYYYMPAVDADWQNYSPGKVHLFKLVEEAIHNDIKVFDHLRGDENYKTGWTDDVQHLYQINLESGKLVSKIKSRGLQLKNKLI